MKTMKVLLAAAAVSLAFFSACNESEPNEVHVPNVFTEDTLPDGEFRIVAIPDSQGWVSFQILAETVSINWGAPDSIVTEWSAPNHNVYGAEYASTAPQVIIGKSKGLTTLSTNHILSKGTWVKLNVSGLKQLQVLNCDEQHLKNLDISYNAQLQQISCWKNFITNLDVSDNSQIRLITCCYNMLSDSSLNALFESLPTIGDFFSSSGSIHIEGNPGSATCQWNIAKNKGWLISY